MGMGMYAGGSTRRSLRFVSVQAEPGTEGAGARFRRVPPRIPIHRERSNPALALYPFLSIAYHQFVLKLFCELFRFLWRGCPPWNVASPTGQGKLPGIEQGGPTLPHLTAAARLYDYVPDIL